MNTNALQIILFATLPIGVMIIFLTPEMAGMNKGKNIPQSKSGIRLDEGYFPLLSCRAPSEVAGSLYLIAP